jgi:hypothetical protein
MIDTLLKKEGGPLPDRPEVADHADCQFKAPPVLTRTLDTLLLTDRIEAIAATAINEIIMVNSITVAPCWSFIKRRKSVSIKNPKHVFLLQTVLKLDSEVNRN